MARARRHWQAISAAVGVLVAATSIALGTDIVTTKRCSGAGSCSGQTAQCTSTQLLCCCKKTAPGSIWICICKSSCDNTDAENCQEDAGAV
jgi:hypothetical protein